MSLKQLDKALKEELAGLQKEGRTKPPERIITGYLPRPAYTAPAILYKAKISNFSG
jgi:hypothetical protein